jgi:hypothetical protein
MNPENKKQFKLDDLKKENPFQVPENYFDSLGSRISDRIVANVSPQKVPAHTFVRLKPVMIYTASIAALALFIYLGVSFFSKDVDHPALVAQTSSQDLNEYAIISGIDEATLLENFPQETSTAVDSTEHIKNKDKIIDYLVNENIDISTIVDEL